MKLIKMLQKSEIFSGIGSEDIEQLLQSIHYQMKTYEKGEIVALEGEKATHVDIVIQGEIAINKLYEDGKQVHIKKMSSGNLIGFALVYSDHPVYANTLVASGKTEIMRISHENMRHLCEKNAILLHNFIRLISNQVVYLSERIKLANYSTIRKKIIDLILKLHRQQDSYFIQLGMTRKKMAESLGVSRPALSQEMIHMKKEGLIDYANQYIEILDYQGLVDMLN